ncbi:DUF7674 family protein [Sphingobacterium kitahiroshimense]|uniref:DUF7674 domain-containing protein n=1 Tax=Sphingobacterium kitahiroshimense TaxID=470446 RepID=A0ABV0BUI7_9SPHI
MIRLLKEIDRYIFNTLISVLYEKFPEYKSVLDSQGGSVYAKNYTSENSSDFSTYLFMNEFSIFLGGKIIEDKTSVFVKKSFEYINLLGQSDNCEILNIVHVGILEILYTEEGVNREFVKMNLSEKLQPYFESWSKYYR